MNSNKLESFVLSLQSVTKWFGSLQCLRDVDLCIRTGEKVALVGGNGSGKTALLDIMCGFIMPTKGSVVFKKSPAIGRHPAWFATNGMLRSFQSPRVFEQMTIMDCLILSGWVPHHPSSWASFIRTRHYREVEATAREKANAILDAVGWKAVAGQLAGQLSYGQRKLLGILQLTLADGDVAVCDEPTAGLDTTQSKRVFDLLLQWQTACPARSILVATHDLEFVGSAFDRAYRITDGCLREISTA